MKRLFFYLFLLAPLFSIAQDENTQPLEKWSVGIQLSTPYNFTPDFAQGNLAFTYPSEITDKSGSGSV